ncbi:amidinotransferase [Bradyrhizobium sp. AUGA SZCCT0274]|uniref:amidinotransferase n=1 Tax=Bradyrhizobium sp. AUGA SZCCT0274 TaxID=2807670 RepID=UPI001BA46CAC|nr:amidinotransferase [Bradyrhizobium sp. AUGA SZCCT0274]MBR1240314.1 amidinotransferase [Bradyrhizobium sp. AUGA SZCCT0274]
MKRFETPGNVTALEAASPVISCSPVNSYNEWDPLEEVIVGIADGARFPAWHVAVEAVLPPEKIDTVRVHAGKPFPNETIDGARRELDTLAGILEREGVTVRRPENRDNGQAFGAPGWTSAGFYQAMPRDVLLVVGEDLIECPMAWRSRYFEMLAYRPLLKNYFASGARWSAAPRPELPDAFFDNDWSEGDDGTDRRFVISEFEPTFDAADFIRCGRDLFVQKSHVTNRFGIDWLRRHLGSAFRIHEVKFDDDRPMHIDASLMPLAPGKLLINPERVRTIPLQFKDWEVRTAPPPPPRAQPLYLCSGWINMNVLTLDPQRVIVEEEDTPMAEAIAAWGFDVIRCPFRHFQSLGGSFHCATLDVRRRGRLESYF